MKTSSILATAAVLLSGCASTWQLALMPRDSGKIYYGTADDVGASEGPIAITIENRAYRGTWVQAVPDHAHSYVGGGAVYPYGRRGWGYGGTWVVDNPLGGETKALLTSADGAGLRCDFRGSQGFGGGLCRDDAGKEYDVQIRQGPPPPTPK